MYQFFVYLIKDIDGAKSKKSKISQENLKGFLDEMDGSSPKKLTRVYKILK